MARTNRPPRQFYSPSGVITVTHEGAPASRISSEQQLRRAVMSCLLWEGTFYESGQTIGERIEQLAVTLPEEVVAAIAIEAREQQNLRHVPLLLARSLARRSAKNTAATLERVIQRADELTEFLSLYWEGKTARKKGPISAQAKKGLAKAFTKFNAYQLAKYNRDDAIKLRDVLFLTHPRPRDDEQAAVWKLLVEGKLPPPDTWEVALSSGESKLNAWTRLLQEEKLGALALLRNLRNMTEAGVDKGLIRTALVSAKTDRVLPFRFITAARYAPWLEGELEQVMFRNLESLPKLMGQTVLLVDASGSMADSLSSKSELSRYDAACGLAMLLREVCETVTIARFNNATTPVRPRRGFALRDELGRPTGGTYTENAKMWADQHGYDRLIIITDEQSAQRLSRPKMGRMNYLLNVAPYTNGIGYGDWIHIDGWSESVVRYIQALEASGFSSDQ